MNAAVLVLVASALFIWPDDTAARRFGRPHEPARKWPRSLGPIATAAGGVSTAVLVGGVAGVTLGAMVTATGWWAIRRARRPRAPTTDIATRLRLAGTLDLLAACLRAGLPVPSALDAVAGTAPPAAAEALRSTAGHLALGSRPEEAW
ncbi:type II secretion system F family protein, partial [Amycolatopsis sp. SID8362]|uniref:type II secretion system F family protein n=1 Tax=Amycolatopsis sp. SID8362 TaxID=2690346 RepID=UPI00136F4E55